MGSVNASKLKILSYISGQDWFLHTIHFDTIFKPYMSLHYITIAMTILTAEIYLYY